MRKGDQGMFGLVAGGLGLGVITLALDLSGYSGRLLWWLFPICFPFIWVGSYLMYPYFYYDDDSPRPCIMPLIKAFGVMGQFLDFIFQAVERRKHR